MVFFAGALRAVAFFAVVFLAGALRAVVLRAVVFLVARLAVVFFAAVVFLAGALRAVVLRAVVFLAAAFLVVRFAAVCFFAGGLLAVFFAALVLLAGDFLAAFFAVLAVVVFRVELVAASVTFAVFSSSVTGTRASCTRTYTMDDVSKKDRTTARVLPSISSSYDFLWRVALVMRHGDVDVHMHITVVREMRCV